MMGGEGKEGGNEVSPVRASIKSALVTPAICLSVVLHGETDKKRFPPCARLVFTPSRPPLPPSLLSCLRSFFLWNVRGRDYKVTKEDFKERDSVSIGGREGRQGEGGEVSETEARSGGDEIQVEENTTTTVTNSLIFPLPASLPPFLLGVGGHGSPPRESEDHAPVCPSLPPPRPRRSRRDNPCQGRRLHRRNPGSKVSPPSLPPLSFPPSSFSESILYCLTPSLSPSPPQFLPRGPYPRGRPLLPAAGRRPGCRSSRLPLLERGVEGGVETRVEEM